MDPAPPPIPPVAPLPVGPVNVVEVVEPAPPIAPPVVQPAAAPSPDFGPVDVDPQFLEDLELLDPAPLPPLQVVHPPTNVPIIGAPGTPIQRMSLSSPESRTCLKYPRWSSRL